MRGVQDEHKCAVGTSGSSSPSIILKYNKHCWSSFINRKINFNNVFYRPQAQSNEFGKKTMELVSSYLDFMTMTDHGLSFYDIMLINRAYRCMGKKSFT